MYAVLRVDLQALCATTCGFVRHKLVHARRAIARFGPSVFGQIDFHWHAGVFQREVGGLVFFVVGVADEHTAQTVEGQLAIGLGINDGFALAGRFEVSVVGLAAVHRPGNVAAQHKLLKAVHQRAHY